MADETNILMPPLGESVVEGTINKWLKAVGDHVDEDELLVEVTTDKINTEIPSVASGTLIKILANEGDTIKVGTPMAVISANGASAVSGAVASAPAASAPAASAPVPEAVAAPVEAAAIAADAEALPAPAAPKEDTGLYPVDPNNVITLPSPKKLPTSNGDPAQQRLREKSSPLVRRILAENNLELEVLHEISGTGAEGRVTKEDILAYIADGKKKAAAPVAPAAPPKPAAGSFGPEPTPSYITPPTDTDAIVTPLGGIRKIIAERLSYSERVAPHVTTFAEVDVTDLVALRAKYKDWAKEDEKVSLTFMPFIIKAICVGLHEFPALNSSLIDGQLYQHQRVHMAVAVSLDQTGLMLPVIKDADRLGILDLARAVQDLAARARSNQLKPDEARGSTFTISNPGAFGGLISTPILNQPNAAIMNTGKIMKMPWVMPDDSIVPRSIMYLSLSYDHRIVDGETSVKFLQFVKRNLEQIDKFLLR